MTTYLEALQWANEMLRAASGRFASPMLDAEVLLAEATEIPRSRLFLRFDAPLRPDQIGRFEGFVRRRAAFEPVAYIVGRKEFAGRLFRVNPFTLIPRPATEALAAAAIELAGEGSRDATIFADVGTGSGAIAVTLAAETHLPVIATDASRPALAVARLNAEAHGVAGLVEGRHGRGLEPVARVCEAVRASGRRLPYDHLILCANLPYLPETRWEELQEDIRRYEPRSALLSGPDGLRDYWELFRALKSRRAVLPMRASCIIEIDPTQALTAPALIRHAFPAASVRIAKDMEGFDRVVIVTGL